MNDRPVGFTKDTGWQIGVRRTLSLKPDDAWAWLTSESGLRAWLGRIDSSALERGKEYALEDGSHGEVRVYSHRSHLRITRNPGDWKRDSTVQVRVIPKGDRSVVSFHEENLPNQEERIARRQHYRSVLDWLEEFIPELDRAQGKARKQS